MRPTAHFSSVRRSTLASAALLALAALLPAASAWAQAAWPSKPITVVVPYPPGGANDMLGRLIGQKMGEALHTQVIVDNKPGAAALIGANAVAKAAPDGYTVLVGGLATHAASPNLIKADYNPLADFEAIGLIGQAPIVVTANNDSPYKSLKDLVDADKKSPGSVMYGSSGNGSPLHLAGEIFTEMSGTKMTHVPYKGGNAHTLDLIGGRLHVIFDTTTAAMGDDPGRQDPRDRHRPAAALAGPAQRAHLCRVRLPAVAVQRLVRHVRAGQDAQGCGGQALGRAADRAQAS